jgi:hypothetical protein
MGSGSGGKMKKIEFFSLKERLNSINCGKRLNPQSSPIQHIYENFYWPGMKLAARTPGHKAAQKALL